MASSLKPVEPLSFTPAPPSRVDELFERFEREASEPARRQLAAELFGLLSCASRSLSAPAGNARRCS